MTSGEIWSAIRGALPDVVDDLRKAVEADRHVIESAYMDGVARKLADAVVARQQEIDKPPCCPQCGEPASHQMPNRPGRTRELWCPNAHYWRLEGQP
jgi:hypothetical protein